MTQNYNFEVDILSHCV